MAFPGIVDLIGHLLEVAGLAVIIGGVAIVAARALYHALLARRDLLEIYQRARQNLGRSILLGLELLVGADIVRTIANQPSL